VLYLRELGEVGRDRLLGDVAAFCRELRPFEEFAYVERRYNDRLIPLARKYALLGIPVSEGYGGRGADAVEYAKALIRIGMEGTGVRTFFSGHTSIGQVPIQSFGTEEQKERYLGPSARGDKILAFALTEPGAGSNPLEMEMTYEARGDRFVLNGTKYLISNAGIAHAIVTFAYPKGRKGGMSAFMVDAGGEGMVREDLVAKVGIPTSNTAMFELHDYAVPKDNLLGGEGEGWKIAAATLMSGRLSVAAGSVGTMIDCLVEATRYAKERSQHGKPIGKHQLVQEHLAIMRTNLDAAYALTMGAARAKGRYDLNPSDVTARKRADRLIAEAKFFASNVACDAADRAVQIFGGRGYSYLYRPGRHWQDLRVCRIYEGTDEIMKLKIASSILGKDFEAYG